MLLPQTNNNRPKILRRLVRTRDTAKLLLLMAEQDLHNPSVLYKAREITRYLSPYDKRSEAIALLQFVRQHVRFVRDPNGIEFVTGPVELLNLIASHGKWAEDCDGQCSLLYALLRAIGHSPRFAFVSFSGEDKIDHVYIEDFIGDRYRTLDPILQPWQVPSMIDSIKRKETLSL